jgi:hypothetical protein
MKLSPASDAPQGQLRPLAQPEVETSFEQRAGGVDNFGFDLDDDRLFERRSLQAAAPAIHLHPSKIRHLTAQQGEAPVDLSDP